MTDKEFFSTYKQSFATIYDHAPEDLVYLKDTDYKYQYVSQQMLEVLGVKDENDVLGNSSYEVATRFNLTDSQVIEEFKQQDEIVTSQKKRKSYLEVLQCNGRSVIIMVHKSPVINPETNNCVGVKGVVTQVFWPHVAKTLFKMHGSRGLLIGKEANGNPLKKYPLNNIQHTVLFLCLNNYSYSEIALLMNEFGYEITPIRVNDYLEQLKLIFHVRNKTQLIEKAIGLNFHLYLPSGLFERFASIEVGSDVAAIVSCNE
jgi:hypothetical protein